MSRYVAVGPENAGGVGTIVVCDDENLDRRVAVKFLRVIGEHRRLLDELAALQRIRSKHVVEIFDVAYFPGSRMGIVQEFIDGEDLRSLLGKVPANEQFLRLLYQMSAGLADIHAVGIVHRDIKPANMMIDGAQILKIIDFNLARPINAAHTQGFVGTSGYAAPELYLDGRVDFSPKVDVYALGVTAYALLKGQALPQELLRRPPQPNAWRARGGFTTLGLPFDQELVSLLDLCLSENPAERPTSAQLFQRVERVLLRGRHKALIAPELGSSFVLDSANPVVTVRHGARLGSVTIRYDGLDFRMAEAEGEVWVNNMQLSRGAVLPGSCVIALGSPIRRANERLFITMDVSHPEVVL